MKVLATGTVGFIGSNLVERLLCTESPIEIIGLDSANDYYDVTLKEYRLKRLESLVAQHPESKWEFVKGNLIDRALIDKLFAENDFDIVVNFAAQAGVRYSITNPDTYVESNLIGFYNILEAYRHSYDGGKRDVQHLVYASSSSVYGSNKKVPYSTDNKLDSEWRVLGMEEKTAVPKSEWAVPPFYIYLKKDLDLVCWSVENGCGKDAPGNLAHCMVEQTEMHA